MLREIKYVKKILLKIIISIGIADHFVRGIFVFIKSGMNIEGYESDYNFC